MWILGKFVILLKYFLVCLYLGGNGFYRMADTRKLYELSEYSYDKAYYFYRKNFCEYYS